MTQYFEIENRDGAARIGKLLLFPEIRTPCALHTAALGDLENPGPVVDAGSLWTADRKEIEARIKEIREKTGKGTLIILPHQTYPPAVPAKSPGKVETFTANSGQKVEAEGPTGSLLRAEGEVRKSDLYIMEGAGTLENNARRFLENLIDLKNRIPPDTALYAPKIALPENAAMLAYVGIDVMDDTRAEIAAYSDIYLTAAGSFYLDSLVEFPCRCRVCAATTPAKLRALPKADRAALLSAHNRDALDAELALIGEKIRAGNLREYVEGQCRVRPWLTALLRLGDFEYSYLEEKVPAFRQNQLLADTSEALSRIEVVRFARRIQERYTPPDLDVLLLLPCAARKPYSTSQSHQKFILTLGKYRKFVHEVIITSPLGIVPRELELTYPASHYDTAVTGHWDEEEKAWVSGCLESYLSKHKYKAVVAHVEGAYREICERVAEKLGIDIVYTAGESLTSYESLSNLKNTVEAICTSEDFSKKRQNAEEEKKNFVKAVAGYQFGGGAGRLFSKEAGNPVVKGRFPKYQLFAGKKQLATLIPQYGMLALSPEGAELVLKSEKYLVKIDDFVPRGSILAPGVLDADPEIRPNDEVIVFGKKALCVGRAAMSGREMKESGRGVAVDVRHVKKL
ncbi:archaeosine tRNA-ribosyltransferase type 2 [Methanosarcina siciliae T4/M]|uniref:Archaeosine tRNA-ribosyltransferase type 2 n=2 Tax=Methanosarcina siciliae TaxID=38027 RepID=A0A0E3P9K0_9EURY|nr:archaeosine synthase subunit alpha [Methanosarcina siciliae]AKB26747.1 archaeosine tRNA-ribosyltransferase type 2 [Methanosarcina siciliae T4/M]AKB30718.1 archaeosine tRNA-ribosyltransferase type 2 [Methanosarcina siciliae HI350]